MDVVPEEYRAIRSLWIAHSKAEDGRDLQGLIDTLSEDCVYELVPSGHRWEGHEGARRRSLFFARLRALGSEPRPLACPVGT